MKSASRIALLSSVAICLGCGRPSADVAHRAPTHTCGWTTGAQLTTTGVGDLRIGLPVRDLRERCAVVRDTTELPEGHPQQVLYVQMGAAVLRAEIVLDSVWRIGVRDSLVRTADGLGVGTPLAVLLAARPEWAANGEDGVVVGLASYCGLSFELSSPPSIANRPLIVRGVADLKRLPASTVVANVLVVPSDHCGRVSGS